MDRFLVKLNKVLNTMYSKSNYLIEYGLLALLYVSVAAVCCGVWHRAVMLCLLPLWVIFHRENYGSHRRRYRRWLLEFLLLAHGKRRGGAILWNPLTYAVSFVVFVVIGIYEGVCGFIENTSEEFKTQTSKRRY